jgi:hypothetical protein
MRDMVMKLGQNGKTIGRIFIVLMMFLLILFLATPASAISVGRNSRTIDNCEVKCTKYEEVKDRDYKNERVISIYSFNVGGVNKKLYVKYTQYCEDGHYSRTCTPFTRCTVNNLCEQSGPIRTETKGYWEECSRWDITDVWVVNA